MEFVKELLKGWVGFQALGTILFVFWPGADGRLYLGITILCFIIGLVGALFI